jgi:hypothetical protein
MAAAVVEFNSVKRGRERHLWDLVNGHKEVLWKQTEPCVALLQITSEMTATTQGRGKRGSFGSFGSFGRKKKKSNTWMNLTRHIKLQVADGESMEFLLGKMRGPVSQDTEMFPF